MEKVNLFLNAVKDRRSRYALTDKSPVSDEQIVTAVKEAVKYAPSAFNSQGARLMVLLGERHEEFWRLTKDVLKGMVPTDKFAPTEAKINSFAAARGTVLYFEDWDVVAGLREKFPSYKDNFPLWAYQSNGMVEFIVWTALAELGIGASLQHYNPIVDDKVREAFGVPKSWKLLAQMPFGEAYAPAEEKSFMPVDERVKVLK